MALVLITSLSLFYFCRPQRRSAPNLSVPEGERLGWPTGGQRWNLNCDVKPSVDHMQPQSHTNSFYGVCGMKVLLALQTYCHHQICNFGFRKSYFKSARKNTSSRQISIANNSFTLRNTPGIDVAHTELSLLNGQKNIRI